MFPQFHMFPINFVLTTTIFILVFLRQKFSSHPRIKFFTFTFLISVLGVVSLLRPGPLGSGDFKPHVSIAMSLSSSLSEGLLVPRWALELCGGYGCPLFQFSYLTPYYLIVLFHLLGFSFIAAGKLLLALSFVGSGLSMYFWARQHWQPPAAFVSAALYLYAPYHLVGMNFRGTVGETLTFALLPLLLLCPDMFSATRKKSWILANIIIAALVILSHQALSLLCLSLWIVYSLFRLRSPLLVGFIFLLAVSLTSFYWIPVLFESRYIHQSQMTRVTFIHLRDLLYSPYKFGLLFQGQDAQLTNTIGFPQLAMVAAGLILLRKKLSHPQLRLNIFFLITFFVSVFFVLPMSRFIWFNLPLLQNFQSTHRVLIITAFSTAALGAVSASHLRLLFHRLPQKFILPFSLLFVYLAMMLTALNWGNRLTLPDETDQMWREELFARGDFNFTPIWFNNTASLPFKPDLPAVEVSSGRAVILPLQRTSTHHLYHISVESPAVIRENTAYFPGWQLFLDGEILPIFPDRLTSTGLIAVPLSPGSHVLELVFTSTPTVTVSYWLSGISLVLLLIAFRPKKLFS